MRELLISTAALLLAFPAMAQVDPKIHKFCIEAKDYKGCVEQHNQNNNKQAVIVEEKLAQAYASLLCEDGNSFAEWTAKKRSSIVALHTGLRYEQVVSESDFDRNPNKVRDEMQRIASLKCPKQQEAYIKKEVKWQIDYGPLSSLFHGPTPRLN